MIQIVVAIVGLLIGASVSHAQSNTCHLSYSSDSAHCQRMKKIVEQTNGYSAGAEYYDKCLNEAVDKQTCCNMQASLTIKNSGSEKGWYIVRSGNQCTGIVNQNEKTACLSCETDCKARMSTVGGLASSCKSLCARKLPLQCGN